MSCDKGSGSGGGKGRRKNEKLRDNKKEGEVFTEGEGEINTCTDTCIPTSKLIGRDSNKNGRGR